MSIIERGFLLYFPYVNSLASYRMGRQCPAVFEERHSQTNELLGYGIRILESRMDTRRGYHTTSWSYFKTDTTGLVIESPRGMAKQFNKRIRYTDMPAAVEFYKDKILNQV